MKTKTICSRCGGYGGEPLCCIDPSALPDSWHPCYHCGETGCCSCPECEEFQAFLGTRESSQEITLPEGIGEVSLGEIPF